MTTTTIYPSFQDVSTSLVFFLLFLRIPPGLQAVQNLRQVAYRGRRYNSLPGCSRAPPTCCIDSHNHRVFLEELVTSITFTLRCLFIQEFEVPYIWVHKCDYISYFNAQDIQTRVELLSLSELWRVYDLGQKYCSLLERKKVLETYYMRLGVTDKYYKMEIRRKVDSVEMVLDATKWLGLKYKNSDKNWDQFELCFHDDEDQVPFSRLCTVRRAVWLRSHRPDLTG